MLYRGQNLPPHRREAMKEKQTYATKSINGGRDDEHMIFEMFNLSQYEDGSVLDCDTMKAFTAQQVVDGAVNKCDCSKVTASKVFAAIRKNTKAAIRNGVTTNLAPRVWRGRTYCPTEGENHHERPDQNRVD
jgi:hypothetical protein